MSTITPNQLEAFADGLGITIDEVMLLDFDDLRMIAEWADLRHRFSSRVLEVHKQEVDNTTTWSGPLGQAPKETQTTVLTSLRRMQTYTDLRDRMFGGVGIEAANE